MTDQERSGSHGGLALAFALLFLGELLAWAGWGRLGYALAPTQALGWVLAVLAFAAVTSLWALTCAPTARYLTRGTPVIKLVVYVIGVLAFWQFGPQWLAVTLAAILLVSEGVVRAAGPERSAAVRASLSGRGTRA